MSHRLPQMCLGDWKPSRDTLKRVSRMMGKIRGHYMAKSKHWWHITLSVTARGLTTTPFPISGQSLEIRLDMTTHQLVIDSSQGWSVALPLGGQSVASLCRQVTATLAAFNIELEPGLLKEFDAKEILPYDIAAIGRYRQTVSWIDVIFRTFKGGLREETSPVQIFPHHFDLAMNWFSGRLVPAIDPADEENADEQMNFGFVTGDDSIAEAYFYATAYPAPANWTDLELPGGAYWHTESWTGAILPYAAVAKASNPSGLLLDYLERVQAHGARLMS